MPDVGIADGNKFLDEVEVDLNMLGALILNGVSGEVDGAAVVAVDESALRQQGMELLEALNEAPEGGVNVDDVGFMVAEEVVLQGQLGVTSHVAVLPGDRLQVGGDGAIDP
jgi:hypothetical protein